MPIRFKDLISADYTQYTQEELDYLAKRARDRKNGRIDEDTENVNEGVGKSIKRSMQGWGGKGLAITSDKNKPQDIVNRVKAYDDKTLIKMAKDIDLENDNKSPAGLQARAIKQELRKRNLNVNEDTSSDREEGTDSLLKKYKSETPGQELDEAEMYVVKDKKSGKAVTKPMSMQMALDAYDSKGGAAKGLAVVKASSIKEEADEVDEALNLQQRMKARQTFKRNKAKIAMGKRRAEKRLASPEKLKQRAQKQARKAVERMILKMKSKEELSFSQRQQLEKLVDKKKAVIDRLAKKLLPKVRQAEKEKKLGNKGKE